MRLTERLSRWFELVRLRSRARRGSSSAAWADLAERLVSFGRTGEALRAAEEGLARFPHSDRLAQVRSFARRGERAAELRRLRDDVARRPTPAHFAQLTALYREIDQPDDALETAREFAERFPLNENGFLAQGEIRLERFLRDRGARDAVLAEEALRRVTRINPRSVRAHLLLAELHWLVGDVPSCRDLVATVLALAPGEPGVADFAESLAARQVACAAPAPEFGELADLVEERRAFANSPERFPGPERPLLPAPEAGPVDFDALRSEVARIGSEPHVVGAVALDPAGAVVAETSAGSTLRADQLAGLAAALVTPADDACRRTDSGALVHAEIEGPAGSVLVARLRDVTLAVVHAPALRSDRAREMVQDALGRAAARSQGAARA